MKDIAGQWYRGSRDTIDEDLQRPKVMKVLESRGFETGPEYLVPDASAFKGEHKNELERALEDMRRGIINVLVFRDTSRIDRSLDLQDIMRRVAKMGGKLISADESWVEDASSKASMAGDFMSVAAGWSNYEYSHKISVNVTEAHRIGRANGYWVGSVPFGFETRGEKGMKILMPHEAEAALVREAYERMADGRTATSIAQWLDGVAPQVIRKTGKKSPWRAKRVIDMIKRPVYKGVHPTATIPEALVPEDLWEHANAAMSARSFETGGRRGVHAYSGVIMCPECSAPLYHHQSTRNGKPVGRPRYRCATGRRGVSSEKKCPFPGAEYAAANEAVEAFMTECHIPQVVMVTEGGDHERQAAIAGLEAQMAAANKTRDRKLARKIMDEIDILESRPPAPVVTRPRKTGKTYAELWHAGTLNDRRGILESYRLVITCADGVRATFADDYYAEVA